MEELTFKAKNVSGKTLSPGRVVYKVQENKFLSWLTKIGLRTARVNPIEANDIARDTQFDPMRDWYFMKDGEIAVKSHTISDIDTSEFNIGDDMYLSNENPGALITRLKTDGAEN